MPYNPATSAVARQGYDKSIKGRRRIKIAPSILSADFSRLEEEIKRVEKAGADMLHIDVMDGHFVPNITIGPVVVKYIRRVTGLPLDTHLMIDDPGRYIEDFVRAGSDMITVHAEVIGRMGKAGAVRWFKGTKSGLKRKKIKLGISLNPDTPLARIKPFLAYADLVLVMSVFPGFGGQKFIPAVLPKIKELRRIFSGDISVDGGVRDDNAGLLIRAGADILASGSYIFNAGNTRAAIERMRNAG